MSAQPPGPVRVAHLLWRLGVGGMEVGVVKLVNNLDRRRVVSSICSFNPADSLKQSLAPDVPLYEFRRRRGNDARLVLGLYRHFRRHRPHVVHTHRWGTLVEGLVAARLARVPIVVHGEHGTMELRSHNLRVQRFVWGRVNQVLSVSSLLAEKMAREVGFPLARVRTIRNGVDLARFRAADRAGGRARLGIPPGDLVIGTVGRLVPVKDQATLLDALARVRTEGIDFRAVLVGEGPLLPALTARAGDLGLADRVTLTGGRSDVPDLLAAYDVFVLSSVSEGLSNVIQEAMASGLPVVATDVGGNRELVGDGVSGLLVPAARPDVMAGAIARLARDPSLRRRMADAGRARAEREFGLETMVRSYEDLYVSLAAPIIGPQHDGQLSEA